jgi:ubiquinone/menaquinone biosynthesis C-methylase UbiE
MAQRGAVVHAVDVSPWAIQNAERNFGSVANVTWSVADVRDLETPPDTFDVVLAYGVFHCLPDYQAVVSVVRRLKQSVRQNGYHIVCAFNNRDQDLERAHPGFCPCLLDHDVYVDMYSDWSISHLSDSDLVETHPHNNIQHRHSMTRLIARRS